MKRTLNRTPPEVPNRPWSAALWAVLFALGMALPRAHAETLPMPSAPCTGGVRSSTDGPIRGTYAAGEIQCLCQESIAKARARLDSVGARSPGRRTFANTMLEFENANADLGDETNPLYFMREVTPSQAMHDEAVECLNALTAFGVEMGARKDLYAALKDQAPEPGAIGAEGQARLARLTVQGFESSGLKLPDLELRQLTALEQTLADLQNQYSDNLAQDHPSITVTVAQSVGMTADFLARQPRSATGDYLIAVTEPNTGEVMQKASNGDTRRRYQLAFTNLGGQKNVDLLNRAVAIRADVAHRLGYATYADEATDGHMAKNAKTVNAFLDDLRVKLQPRVQPELASLLTYKKKLEPAAVELFPWDVSYVSYQIRKNELKVDEDEIAQYFPADVVTKGLFEIYSQMLSVSFREVVGATSWAPGVKLYEIHDERTGDSPLIAYFYADLVPRPLKYNHAAAFTLIQGRALPGPFPGIGYNKPVSAIVANLTPGTAGRQPLLTHDDVVTFFHEFGHIMHQTLTKAPFASLSGTSVARDFVEAPSQMLENWVWQPEILAKLSGHWQDHARKLPQDLLDQLLKARDFNQGTAYAKQTLLARFDMALHLLPVGAPVDSQATYDGMYFETVGMRPLAGNRFPANFGHLMGGYAADMFTQFSGGHTLDPAVGARYRTEILEKGNMVDADVLVDTFLGRPFSNAAFLRKLGI